MLQARTFQVVTSNLFAVRFFCNQSNLFVTPISRKDHGIRFQRYAEAGHGHLARANLRLFEPQYPARQLVLSAPLGAGRGDRPRLGDLSQLWDVVTKACLRRASPIPMDHVPSGLLIRAVPFVRIKEDAGVTA